MRSRDALLSALDAREIRRYTLHTRTLFRCVRCGRAVIRPGRCALCTVELAATASATEETADF